MMVSIPEKENQQLWMDFRPISLYNIICKILSKILYIEISPNHEYIINLEQLGFVLGS